MNAKLKDIPEVKAFLDTEIAMFANDIANILTTNNERIIWTTIQAPFQNVFGPMIKVFGREKTEKIIQLYLRTEKNIDEFTEQYFKEKK